VRRKLERHAAHRLDERRLGRCIRGVVGPDDTAADDRGVEDDAAGDARGNEVTRARLGQEDGSSRVDAERPVPLLRREVEERLGRKRARGTDEGVEPAVPADDVRDERLRSVDQCNVRRVRRRGRAEPLDCRLEVAVGQVDAGHPRPGRDEGLGAGEADASLRPGDKRDLPVEPPRVGCAHPRSGLTWAGIYHYGFLRLETLDLIRGRSRA
jgi:hypothetical protein